MLVWVAAAVFVLGVAGGLAFAIVRGITMWRDLKRTSRAFGEHTTAITRSLDEIDGHLQRAGKSNEQLAAASERLRSSRERLAVQLAAVHEARVAMSRTFWFLPGR